MGKPPRGGVFQGVSGVPLARVPETGTLFVPACSLSQAAAREARAATGAQPSSEEGVPAGLRGLCQFQPWESVVGCSGGVPLRGGLAEEGLSFQ